MNENSFLCNACYGSNYLLLLKCGFCVICRSCYEKHSAEFNRRSNYKSCEFCDRPHNYPNIIDLSKENEKTNIFNLFSSEKITQLIFEKLQFEENQRKIYVKKLKKFSQKPDNYQSIDCFKELPTKENELYECFKSFLTKMQYDSNKIIQTTKNFNTNEFPVHRNNPLNFTNSSDFSHNNSYNSNFSNIKKNANRIKNHQHNGFYQTPDLANYEYNKNQKSTEKTNNFYKNEDCKKFPETTETERKIRENQSFQEKFIEKINSHCRNEQFLQKVTDFHKKHEAGGIEDMKEVSMEKEHDESERKEENLKRIEVDNLENSERFSKKLKLI